MSDDALPTLVHELPSLCGPDRMRLGRALVQHRHPHARRSGNLARSRADGRRKQLEGETNSHACA